MSLTFGDGIIKSTDAGHVHQQVAFQPLWPSSYRENAYNSIQFQNCKLLIKTETKTYVKIKLRISLILQSYLSSLVERESCPNCT